MLEIRNGVQREKAAENIALFDESKKTAPNRKNITGPNVYRCSERCLFVCTLASNKLLSFIMWFFAQKAFFVIASNFRTSCKVKKRLIFAILQRNFMKNQRLNAVTK